jgi:hypothetical protein
MRRFLVLSAVLFLPACGPRPSPQPADDAPDAARQHDGGPKTKGEEAVRAYILDNAGDPESVEFSRWGPHDLAGALRESFRDARWVVVGPNRMLIGQPMVAGNPILPVGFFDKADEVYRVRARGKNGLGAKSLLDILVAVHDGKPYMATPNPYGDDWLERTAKAMEDSKKPVKYFGDDPPAPPPSSPPQPPPPPAAPPPDRPPIREDR